MNNISNPKSIFRVLAISFCFFVLSCSSSDDGEKEPEANFVQTTLNDYESSFPKGGAVAYVLESDGTVTTGAIGESEPDIPLEVGMRYAIGSTSKTFTAILIYKLIESGELSLASTIEEIVPEIVNTKIPGTVTVEQLLNHSSGLHHPLPGSDGLFNYVINNPSEEITFETFVSFMDLPDNEPGEIYSYSDANFKILGLMVEKITGNDFETQLGQVLLNPLGLSDTYIGTSTPRPNQAYSWVNEESLKDLNRTAVESMGTFTGNIWASPADLAKWFKAIFEGGIINANSLDVMTTFHPGTRGVTYGAGMFRETLGGKQMYWYSGFTIAYGTYCGYIPSTGDVVVVINNQFNFEEITAIVADLVEQL
ncbi:beta-lactamase family protein [Muricauda sp. CAU 1633]|uniref:serine hydrolase domain-containing protein n=1 Tax=Allomuricauda sp. CAU 1633 TaxID=2816036 RepID=UPI001A8CD301|nr:serine hydrolase domain-containing protein [Muricauda sp. CAU 1633]MBO0322910.1 beta-lactamase family protein [Muricauda sp. CAU 1633]